MFLRAGACVIAACALMFGLAACRGPRREPVPQASAAAEPDWFVDAAQSSGLDFTHFNGMSGQYYYPEIMAPGAALLDYDSDGDLDVYLVQGQMLGAGNDARDAIAPPRTDRLFRNDLTVNAVGGAGCCGRRGLWEARAGGSEKRSYVDSGGR